MTDIDEEFDFEIDAEDLGDAPAPAVASEQLSLLVNDLHDRGVVEIFRVDLEVDLFFDVSHVRTSPPLPRRTGSRRR